MYVGADSLTGHKADKTELLKNKYLISMVPFGLLMIVLNSFAVM
jgi:hypothetical protein